MNCEAKVASSHTKKGATAKLTGERDAPQGGECDPLHPPITRKGVSNSLSRNFHGDKIDGHVGASAKFKGLSTLYGRTAKGGRGLVLGA